MKALLIALLLLSTVARAESDSADVHFAAHFGLSYALTTAAYGIANRALRFKREDALIFSAVAVFTGGLLRQVMAAPMGTPVNTAGVAQNALGIGAAAGTVLTFGF